MKKFVILLGVLMSTLLWTTSVNAQEEFDDIPAMEKVVEIITISPTESEMRAANVKAMFEPTVIEDTSHWYDGLVKSWNKAMESAEDEVKEASPEEPLGKLQEGGPAPMTSLVETESLSFVPPSSVQEKQLLSSNNLTLLPVAADEVRSVTLVVDRRSYEIMIAQYSTLQNAFSEMDRRLDEYCYPVAQ